MCLAEATMRLRHSAMRLSHCCFIVASASVGEFPPLPVESGSVSGPWWGDLVLCVVEAVSGCGSETNEASGLVGNHISLG